MLAYFDIGRCFTFLDAMISLNVDFYAFNLALKVFQCLIQVHWGL